LGTPSTSRGLEWEAPEKKAPAQEKRLISAADPTELPIKG